MGEEKVKPIVRVRNFYEKKYKQLTVLPFILLFLAMLAIAFQYMQTGDFIIRDVSLKGGLTITVPTDAQIDEKGLESYLGSLMPSQFQVRELSQLGKSVGFVVTSDADGANQENIDLIISGINEYTKQGLMERDYTVEFIGSSLGASFFIETIKAMVVAFIWMGAVVFLTFSKGFKNKAAVVGLTLVASFIIYSFSGAWTVAVVGVIAAALIYLFFRFNMPSLAVVLSAFSDIVITLAIINLLGVKLSTAGIAAFLMLIGYSVDTDILLTTRVLKRREGTVFERTLSAFRTGITMTITTLIAVTVAYLLTPSDVIKQIMLILIIGLLVDIINTWLQNAGLLRWFLEPKAEAAFK